MEEENKNKNENENIDTNEIIKETANTFNEVKDQVKESFKKEELKKSAKETKNFIVGMFKNPISELKSIAEDSQNKNFKYAIILIIVWMVAILIWEIRDSIVYSSGFFKTIGSSIKALIVPILAVFITSVITMVISKKKDKSLVTFLTVISAAKLPIVIANVANLLRLISYGVENITYPFYALCEVVSAVLLFFGIKFLNNEEDDNTYIKKFVIIEAIYCVAAVVARLLGIYIY